MVVGGNPKTAREFNDAIVYSELYSMVEMKYTRRSVPPSIHHKGNRFPHPLTNSREDDIKKKLNTGWWRQ